MSLIVRNALSNDAAQMCDLLNEIIALGGTTAHRSPFYPAKMQSEYILNPRGVSCRVAVERHGIVGFQCLERADPNWGGDHPLPSDWGVIATFVADGQQGQGIGRTLFHATVKAARAANLVAIDATIRKENTGGLAFYAGLGFVDYCERGAAQAKRFDLQNDGG